MVSIPDFVPYDSVPAAPERIGSCRVTGEIGSGGMAVIYKAEQESLGRTVAIKQLKPTIALDSAFAKRFEREARFMAALHHENILQVHDFVADDTGMYITMEYIDGIDVYDLLDRAGKLPADVAAVITLQVARALDYAHFRGIIHRDIKPANIMLARKGEVKLMDFGIARDDSLADLTEVGTGIGTPSYMSPEQILGDKLDSRSDVFSLGIVLYQMLTGKKPFVDDGNRSVMQKIRLDRYTRARKITPTVPRQLEHILARCMEKLPANRYPTTQALIDDLIEFLAPRVTINHSACLVLYLRELGVIPENHASEILSAGAARGHRSVRAVERTLLRRVGLMSAGLLGAVLATAGTLHVLDDGAASATAHGRTAAGRLLLRDAGFVRLVVKPWAEVQIDGEHVATTPHAEAIPLAPGPHYVKLVNPHYQEAQLQIQVRSGETETLKVELERKKPPKDPSR